VADVTIVQVCIPRFRPDAFLEKVVESQGSFVHMVTRYIIGRCAALDQPEEDY
jgi:hypothetical protein